MPPPPNHRCPWCRNLVAVTKATCLVAHSVDGIEGMHDAICQGSLWPIHQTRTRLIAGFLTGTGCCVALTLGWRELQRLEAMATGLPESVSWASALATVLATFFGCLIAPLTLPRIARGWRPLVLSIVLGCAFAGLIALAVAVPVGVIHAWVKLHWPQALAVSRPSLIALGMIAGIVGGWLGGRLMGRLLGWW